MLKLIENLKRALVQIGKIVRKGKESQSGLLSAVKYWYDPTSPEQIGLAQPVKNLLTQFVRNYYG